MRQRYILQFLLFLLLSHTSLAFAHNSPYYSHDSGIDHSNPDWLSLVPGQIHLKDLSLPGTHDTMSLYGGDIVQTQSMSLSTQLSAGIRVLDIRCRRIDNKFAIHHGLVYQHANFDDVLIAITQFLAQHPRETVLMRLSEEYDVANSTLSFAEIFNNYINDGRYSNFIWRGADANPTLDAVRGKVVILRNFSNSNTGLNYHNANIQDQYNVSTNWDLYGKWTAVKNQLYAANASNAASRGMFMNYLSASGGSFPYFIASGHSSPGTSAPRLATGLTTPGWNGSYPDFPRVDCFIGICTIAFEGTNILTANLIDNARLSFVGIIMADFPGQGLIDKIIRLNPTNASNNGVSVFEHSNYQGRVQSLGLGRYNLSSLSIGNDIISSVTVRPGWKVTLFEHADFQGRSKVLTGDSSFLSDFNDTVSSLIVEIP